MSNNTVTIRLRPHQKRAVSAMEQYAKGQIIKPTGAGKTLTMIFDCYKQLQKFEPQTIVVVAPRILLAEQLSSEFLEFITNAKVFHCHSGETHHESSTKHDKIYDWVEMNGDDHKLIFTTYNSLNRLQEVGIEVDTIYFDEAHNSVKSNFYPATEYYAQFSNRCYFFTATPKHSVTPSKPGMNNASVYGQVICNVPAPELVAGGFIIPPKVVVKQLPMTAGRSNFERDADVLIETIDENEVKKVLVCAKATKQIVGVVSESNFCEDLKERGYSVMYITSRTGAVIDGKKVNREVFFDTLNAWSKDNNKKFVILHHSILSEGINVSGLEAVLFMRNMDFIGISQTIGRVIRLHHEDAIKLSKGEIEPGNLDQYTKSFGLVCIPVYTSAGINTARAVQTVVDTIFEKGEPAISVVRR